MRILFDAYWWQKGPISNRQILHDVIKTWIADFPADQILLAVRKGDFEDVRAQFPTRIRIATTRLSPQGVSAILELPLLARRARVDAIITHNFTPLFGRSAVLIHDVLFQTNPEWFTTKERLYFGLMPLSAPRADVVFATSEVEAARIRANNRRLRSVVPVGLAVGTDLLAALPVPPPANLTAQGFILTVGRLNVRKNLEQTLRAAIASGRFSADFPLVLAGSYQGRSTVLSADAQRAIDDGAIVLLGFVTAEELSWLYANAAVFVFMSVGEGFGLPPLEALTFGTRVIASDIPVMREVLGEHAQFVDLQSDEAMTKAFSDFPVEENSTERSGRQSYALARYTWQKVVARMRNELLLRTNSGKGAQT